MTRGAWQLLGPIFAAFLKGLGDVEGSRFSALPGGVPGLSVANSTNDRVYSRDPQGLRGVGLSSHLKEHREQYGIDIRFASGGRVLEILPNAGHTHILFGFIKGAETNSYVKIEPEGLGALRDVIKHNFNFLNSQMQERGMPESCVLAD